MKITSFPPVGAIAFWLGMAATSYGQLTIHYDFTPGSIVTDNGQLSIVGTLGGLSGLTNITDVNARLNLTTGTPGNPVYLGDLYSSLTFGNTSETQRTAVLLNRPGRDNTDAFGSGLSSLNVTLDDSASTNVWAATVGTGTYQADGRLSVDPNAAGVAFASGSNGLSALNGTPLTSNRVSLLVADYSQGGVATLAGWGLSATGAAASTGTFTPGANAWIGDTGSLAINNVGAILDTTGATGGSLASDLAGTTTFSGGVTGSAGITKEGTGTLILSGTNSYSGTTDVNTGILAINGDQSTATGSVSINNPLTRLIGTGIVGGDTTVNTGAIQSAGGAIANVDKVGKLTFDAAGASNTSLTFGSGSIFEWDLNANKDTDGYDHDSNIGTPNTNVGTGGTDFDAVDVSGTLTVASEDLTGTIFRVVLGSSVVSDTFWQQTQTWTNIFGGGYSLSGTGFNTSLLQVVDTAGGNYDQSTLNPGYGFTITGTSLTWTAVPEPSSVLVGLLITAGLLRRRRAGVSVAAARPGVSVNQ